MVTKIENTKLFNRMILLEPEYYYRIVPQSYGNEIKDKWRALLTEFSITFNPIIFHHYKKAGKKQDRIDLEDKNRNELRITPEDVGFNLMGDKND